MVVNEHERWSWDVALSCMSVVVVDLFGRGIPTQLVSAGAVTAKSVSSTLTQLHRFVNPQTLHSSSVLKPGGSNRLVAFHVGRTVIELVDVTNGDLVDVRRVDDVLDVSSVDDRVSIHGTSGWLLSATTGGDASIAQTLRCVVLTRMGRIDPLVSRIVTREYRDEPGSRSGSLNNNQAPSKSRQLGGDVSAGDAGLDRTASCSVSSGRGAAPDVVGVLPTSRAHTNVNYRAAADLLDRFSNKGPQLSRSESSGTSLDFSAAKQLSIAPSSSPPPASGAHHGDPIAGHSARRRLAAEYASFPSLSDQSIVHPHPDNHVYRFLHPGVVPKAAELQVAATGADHHHRQEHERKAAAEELAQLRTQVRTLSDQLSSSSSPKSSSDVTRAKEAASAVQRKYQTLSDEQQQLIRFDLLLEPTLPMDASAAGSGDRAGDLPLVDEVSSPARRRIVREEWNVAIRGAMALRKQAVEEDAAKSANPALSATPAGGKLLSTEAKTNVGGLEEPRTRPRRTTEAPTDVPVVRAPAPELTPSAPAPPAAVTSQQPATPTLAPPPPKLPPPPPPVKVQDVAVKALPVPQPPPPAQPPRAQAAPSFDIPDGLPAPPPRMPPPPPLAKKAPPRPATDLA